VPSSYFIDLYYGSLHYTEFLNTDFFYIKEKYPKLESSCAKIRNSFKDKGIILATLKRKWTKETIIEAIQRFYKENNKIPQFNLWHSNNSTSGYPSTCALVNYFGSWNKAIHAAGFDPNINDGFGNRTTGLDGHLYRSRAEAEFCNRFLFEKYEYSIEPKYPNPYNKYYDWYVKELDLYIELDGEIRPKVIKEKIDINKQLKRQLLVIKTSSIYKYNQLKDFI